MAVRRKRRRGHRSILSADAAAPPPQLFGTATAQAHVKRTNSTAHAPLEATSIEILLEFVLWIVLDVVFTVLSELGISRALRRRVDQFKSSASLGAGVAAFVLGAGLSMLIIFVHPVRIWPSLPFTGASVVVSPAVAAVLMSTLGAWRRQRDLSTTILTEPAGAAAFAFGFAVTRVVWLYFFVAPHAA